MPSLEKKQTREFHWGAIAVWPTTPRTATPMLFGCHGKKKKRATDTSLKKKLKTPIFVDLSLKVKVSMRQSRLWCTPVFHNNASLAGNGPVSLNSWWGGGAASKPKLGMSRVKLLIPFQEKQKMERPPQRRRGRGGGAAEQRTGGAWRG